MTRVIHLFGLAAVMVASTASAQQPMPESAAAIEVVSRPIALNPEAPSETRVGALTYQGGAELVSPASNFGGLSGLVVASDESHLIAITDNGQWLCASLELDSSDTLRGIRSAWMSPLKGLPGYDLEEKENADSEAIAVTPDRSAAYVSFEGTHRIWRYDIDDRTDLCSVAASTPTATDAPDEISALADNGGIESLDVLPSGALIMIGEDRFPRRKDRPGWIGKPGAPFKAFLYKSPPPFSPTDLKAVDGGYLILHRHFSVFSGVSGAIGWAAHEQPMTQPPSPTKIIVEFAPPVSVDNFEGLAVLPDGKGGYTLYVVSDDNFSPFQRTLLMKFSLSKDAFNGLKQTP